jgi:uncharacterized protein (DUF427 family)/acyl-CoA thioesterase
VDVAEIRSAWPEHPSYRIDLVPARGTAVVRVGDTVLARSDRAVRLIETDHVERLYIPRQDVALDRLEPTDNHTVCPFKGRASYWSFPAGESAGEDLFWAYPEPFTQVAGIDGLLGVYHERANVEIETRWPDGSRAVNHFPAWGDEDDLLRLLEPVATGEGEFVAPGYHVRARNVVEGGQLLGQAVAAAARTAPEQRVTWASMTFPRAADFDDPLHIDVDPIRRGRTFSTFSIRLQQRGKLVAPALVLLDTGAPDSFRDVEPMSDVPGPESSEPYDMSVTGRDLRIVDGDYSPDPDRVGPPEIHAWMRWRDDPAELCLRQALVAQATTHWTIAAGMLPHAGFGEARAHDTLSTGPMAVSMSFHDDAPLDRWFLYSTYALWSGRGLVQGDGRVWSAGGTLIASYTLQAMVRDRLAGAGDKDMATAM